MKDTRNSRRIVMLMLITIGICSIVFVAVPKTIAVTRDGKGGLIPPGSEGSCPQKGGIVGGDEISYDKYPGKAKIVRIEKTEQSKLQARETGYEGYEVWFTFSTNKKIKQKWACDVVKKEHLFQLMNSWYVGDKYISKYGIVGGKVFECTLCVITSGTATPVTFDFKKLNRTDYFETKKKKR